MKLHVSPVGLLKFVPLTRPEKSKTHRRFEEDLPGLQLRPLPSTRSRGRMLPGREVARPPYGHASIAT